MDETLKKQVAEKYKISEDMATNLYEGAKIAVAVCEAIKQAVEQIWRDIQRMAEKVDTVRQEIDKEKKYRQSWHISYNTVKNHQVLNRKPLQTKVRSQL